MKKLFKPFAVLAAAALVSACSNNEPDAIGGAEGDEGLYGYIAVNIQDAGEMLSKAPNSWDNDQVDNAGNGDYIHGDADEHTVKTARFFFYDAQGVYKYEASVWKDAGAGNTENIEWMGKNLLVLKGLTENTTPNYMITVLNAPAGFTPGNNIDETRNALVGIKGVDGAFVMSTTSFLGTNASDKYGTNKLTANNFQLTPKKLGENESITIDPAKVVEVYVERLAAKIQVLDALEGAETWNGEKYYKVMATVGGDNNNEDDPDYNEDQAGLSSVYIKFSNWGINGQTPNSYMTKNIEGFEETGAKAPWATWNNNDYRRSFWGKSVVYDKAINGNLVYIDYNGAKIALGNSDYCPENTNTVDNIVDPNNKTRVLDKNVTSVIFTAQVFEKKADNTFAPLDMVRYHGSLYRKPAFLAEVLSSLNVYNKLNYWVEKTTSVTRPGEKPGDQIIETETKWTQLNAEDLKLDFVKVENGGTGIVYVQSTLKAEDGLKYHTRSAKADGTGYEYSGELTFDEAAIATLNENLKKFYSESETLSTANAYKDGKCFYSIPVEHLVKKAAENNVVIGNYGVVRNHWYRIMLQSVANIGVGVFNPGSDTEKGEEIITTPDDEDYYHVGANVNILSWKIVTQNVHL